jgi:starch phosphorylase
MDVLDPFTHSNRIAYFSMEIALRDEIPTYSGGLGILAGDTLRSSADLELPLVGVTLISRKGYFRQEIDADGKQVEHDDPWNPPDWVTPLDARIAIAIEGRTVWVQPWLYVLEGSTSYAVPVIMLDTDLPENSAADRDITSYLYGDGEPYRLKQEIVLGIAGTRLLRALGFNIHTYHMNEGHSALLALELLRQYERPRSELRPGESCYDVTRVREQCVFTTHTPVEAGHDQFAYSLVRTILDDYMDMEELQKLAGKNTLNMTRLALNLSGYVNGVAKRHAEISTHLFPGYQVHAITNGIHPLTWISPGIAELYDKHVPGWRHEPENLVRADQIEDEELWSAHLKAKGVLAERIDRLTGVKLSLQTPIIGFARRMTSYKRPDLLFSDIARLNAIAERYPFQIILAGKAHPHDGDGKRLIQYLHQQIKKLSPNITAVFVPDYRMDIAYHMVSGADIWLNTPLRPREASGTSGMKAAMNGVLNLSILDGWWIEGHIEGVTGWSIGNDTDSPESNGGDAVALYAKLEHTVLPLYYLNKNEWISMMKQAMAKNAYYFNSHRMMRRYATEAYLR